MLIKQSFLVGKKGLFLYFNSKLGMIAIFLLLTTQTQQGGKRQDSEDGGNTSFVGVIRIQGSGSVTDGWQVGHDSCCSGPQLISLIRDIIQLVWSGPSPSLVLLRLSRFGWAILSHYTDTMQVSGFQIQVKRKEREDRRKITGLRKGHTRQQRTKQDLTSIRLWF